MKIFYLNNSGGGFADNVEIQTGMTVGDFFKSRHEKDDPADFLIRVNRQPVSSDYVLQDGDRLTATPMKIEGAYNMRR
jgi:sulfur carrier protein ThiS